ncbi:hypothetical protein [Peterkaempfera bronchialis]|uniref:Uncharacterized protein n=1 Tax=Peterkaempfera bronchialis TaxID=2126346 RepID=A0A345SRP4_9ACTN|nr:hypothetical protein [Peterkaempfera bronchialis]AXI76399.1 hypothetical protein C7M71_001800 [Peterkaempfera bronchialis]
MSDEARPHAAPPGWPPPVPPPGAEGWEREAQRWLWELLPVAYRRYELLHRQPVLLARQVLLQVEAELVALRKGYRSARVDLAGLEMEPAVVEEALRLYAAESDRLHELARQARTVTDALVHGAAQPGPGGPG